MAIDDLDTLRGELPEIFDDKPLPPAWEDDWLIVPIDNPESESIGQRNHPDYEDPALSENERFTDTLALTDEVVFQPEFEIPTFGDGLVFPGASQSPRQPYPVPPPDALAFYLPFHYFHPRWWGIYLVLEHTQWLALQLNRYSQGSLNLHEAMIVSRLFLYGHEAFHHSVEAFATRLEVTHRVPLYREGFEKFFRHGFGTKDCIEEALATAYGYRKVNERAFRKPNNPSKRATALQALAKYVRSCPPGYDRALEFVRNRDFSNQRSEFAEQNHKWALPSIPSRSKLIWLSFPHAFYGISRVTSRVNYLVHRGSSLANRHQLSLRYVRYQDLSERLQRLAGCKLIREGGAHEIWESPKGHRFPVPRHPGDLRKGTLAKIIKQSGMNPSVSEFAQARL
jgi:predicted RNA binding protein YcfA (HicA-like mRNA interferase family)